MATYHIEAKRWFQKTYGNTYHSVTIFKDGAQIARIPYAYGYGEQWLETALAWLDANGHINRKRYENGVMKDAGTRYFREELVGTYEIEDVNRKRDL